MLEALGAITAKEAEAEETRTSGSTAAYQDSVTAPLGREHDDEAVQQDDVVDEETDASAVRHALTKVSVVLPLLPSSSY